MAKSEYYRRTMKIQISSDDVSGGTRARVGIPVRIQRDAAIDAGDFIEWKEISGKILCTPALETSLHTSAFFSSGRQQLYCGFPGVFCRKYGIEKGSAFHWEMKAKKVQGFLEVRKLPRREIRAKDKSIEKIHTVKILRYESRLRINIPAGLCQLLNIKPGYFMRWEEVPEGIQCIPDVYEHMSTTMIEKRKAGMQVEIPKLLFEKYNMQGGECTWKLQNGKLAGYIELSV